MLRCNLEQLKSITNITLTKSSKFLQIAFLQFNDIIPHDSTFREKTVLLADITNRYCEELREKIAELTFKTGTFITEIAKHVCARRQL